MSLIREVMSGYASRLRLENSLQLQKAKLIRPSVIKLEVAKTIHAINGELTDPELKKVYDATTITIPE